MDQEQPSSGRRKGKFTPKGGKTKPTVPKSEVSYNTKKEDEAAQAQKLVTKFNENLRRDVPKVQKKSSVQVAFGPGTTSTSLRKYGVPRDENAGNSSRSEIKDSIDDDGKIISSSLSTVTEDGSIDSPSDAIAALPLKIKKDYRQPWDYKDTYYPTTLPLREPYSGDPELLDEAELGMLQRNWSIMRTLLILLKILDYWRNVIRKGCYSFNFPPSCPLSSDQLVQREKKRLKAQLLHKARVFQRKKAIWKSYQGIHGENASLQERSCQAEAG
ncbi:hypothetical protein GH714_025980 [Hevea brasiliensis]|uniref:Uncharacterized protein n=1 Tax=Hevea brasiliensis TaxID=3981 RepID=A0A6A6MH14_HEVBR|nr:hypothetical protein GH714_025980 [Hevea brasiliensis]